MTTARRMALSFCCVLGCGVAAAELKAQTVTPRDKPDYGPTTVEPGEEPRHPQYGPAVPDPRRNRRQPMVDGEPAEGPLDPGPYPEMPGYFTNRARNRNDRQARRLGGFNFPAIGFGSSPGYFPGVYPDYDAEYHYQWYKAYKRERALVERSSQQRTTGRELLFEGNFERAALALLGAAELNHTDASSRIHAGHALFALGRYDEAHSLLRRALELQPSLAFSAFDPREDYRSPELFEKHMMVLRDHIRSHPTEAGPMAVLGYMQFYVEGPTRALPALKRAVRLSPGDSLARRLYDAASQASFNPEVIDPSRGDNRTYDEMGIESRNKWRYDDDPRYRSDRKDPRDEREQKRKPGITNTKNL